MALPPNLRSEVYNYLIAMRYGSVNEYGPHRSWYMAYALKRTADREDLKVIHGIFGAGHIPEVEWYLRNEYKLLGNSHGFHIID